MLLDNLSAPVLTLLLSLSFIAILVIYDRFNKHNMQLLLSEHSLLPSIPSTLPSNDKISATVNSDATADIGVLSYLLYRAMGNRESKIIADQPLPVSSPSPPRPPPQIRSPHKRGSRGGRTRSKHTKQTRAKETQVAETPYPTAPSPVEPPRAKQLYEYFLVFDVEATCVQGQDFNWCNEIIEFPVVLLKWIDKTADGKASTLVKVDEFHTFVRPTFRPTLSSFCTSLTGISQAEVDNAPTFAELVPQFKEWLAKHKLLCPRTERKLQRFIWCTDGPFDIRDFVVKQCFISKIKVPYWFRTDVMDVRKVVTNLAISREQHQTTNPLDFLTSQPTYPMAPKPQHFRRPSLNITSQLNVLSLAPFKGRQHSGIDDSRNIARIVTELARLGISLEPNLNIDPGRRWYWMGARPGEIWEDYL